MSLKVRLLLATIILAASALSATAAEKFPFTERELVGSWETHVCGSGKLMGPDPNDDHGIYFHRAYHFTLKEWRAQYIFFADQECKTPLYIGVWGGRYKLLGISKTDPHAREFDALVKFTRLTVLSPELLPKVRGCGKGEWSVGIEKDVGGTGCKSLFPAFSPVSEALTDHDIVGIDGNQFAPGYRIPTMLDHANAPRPTRRQQGIGAIRN